MRVSDQRAGMIRECRSLVQRLRDPAARFKPHPDTGDGQQDKHDGDSITQPGPRAAEDAAGVQIKQDAFTLWGLSEFMPANEVCSAAPRISRVTPTYTNVYRVCEPSTDANDNHSYLDVNS